MSVAMNGKRDKTSFRTWVTSCCTISARERLPARRALIATMMGFSSSSVAIARAGVRIGGGVAPSSGVAPEGSLGMVNIHHLLSGPTEFEQKQLLFFFRSTSLTP